MSSTKIQVKLRETGALITTDERIAYRLFAQDIADINPNAEILGANNENEESEIRMTIRALVEMKLRTPHGKAFAHGDEWSEMETKIEKVLTEDYFVEHPQHASDGVIFMWLREKHPELATSYKTVERRLRAIRAKSVYIETDGHGNYWSKKKIQLAQ